jgi:PD-(D/E)XK nuclease superfamily protein
MSLADGSDHVPSYDEMESLFVNNVDLDTIRSHLSRFNPIKTMGMERMEIRHSAILGWLLSPQETHGLGDVFLKAFLAQALRGHDSKLRPSALEVSQANMIDAEVRREWRHIDLLVLSPRNGWIFLIENKFDSSQHGNQLKRYMDVVESTLMTGDTYRDLRGVFLTLWEEEAADARYAPIEYATVCELLEQCALSGRVPLAPEVEQFLKHYLDVIKEAAGMNEEQEKMEKLARQLYRDHRRVLDFVIEHGKSTDFIIACEAVFGDELEYGEEIAVGKQSFVFSYSDANHFSFLPKSWFEALGDDELYWHGCENWWAGFPVIMWLQLTSDADSGSGQVRLYAEVGPLSDHDVRRELIESIKEAAEEKGLGRIIFQRGAADEGKKYSKFFKKNFFPVEDVQDHEQIANAIKKALKSFQPEIEAVASVLPDFRDHGSEESSE